jgi:hypothetical protein
MLPGLKDVRDFLDALRYNLGRRQERPRFGRYNFEEKMEYWAVIWGTLIMILTGFILWNPIASTQWLPGQIVPMAKAAHGGEALLAVLSIITWHVYNVHIKHFNKSIFTGRLTREEMLQEHPLELARIEAGADALPPPMVVRRRHRLYLPISMLFTVVSLFLIYVFVTLETTAIETVPPQPTQVVFQRAIPQMTPSPALIAEQTGASIPHGLTRHENCVRCHAQGTLRPFPDDHIGYGNERCLECHAPMSEASQQVELAGENVPSFETQIKPTLEENCIVCHGVAGGLNLTDYSWLMAGGNAGQVIVPGQPEQSLMLRVLRTGHFADLPAETQTALEEWILMGAPNN